MRASGVVWRDTFPGNAELINCKFKFYQVKQAEEFFARLDSAKLKVKSHLGADGEIKDDVWTGHIPSVVSVNCEKEGDDDLFLK